MAEGCKTPNCTVALTGNCLLENDPKTCPERIATDIDTSALTDALTQPLATPESMPTFPASLTMSLSDISELMADRYCKVVGILGAPDAGKTAVLVCLYLLLAHSKLSGYRMRNSATLQGLDQISRGARRWRKGDAPGKLTAHTEAKDERAAGFLHFRLLQKSSNVVADILFPDLPGEWSTALIETNDKERLDFLKTADCNWIMADGVDLTTDGKRQTVQNDVAMLIQRVKALCGDDCSPISLVITRRDKGLVPEAAYAPIVEEAQRQGVAFTVHQIASFSEDDGVEPGAGLSELMDSLFAESEADAGAWPLAERRAASRQMLRYRASQEVA